PRGPPAPDDKTPDPAPPDVKPAAGYQYALAAPLGRQGRFTQDVALTQQDLKEEGYPYKLFLARLEEGQSYRLEMKSADFDAYLRVLTSPQGRRKCELSLAAAGSKNEPLELRPQPGGAGGYWFVSRTA